MQSDLEDRRNWRSRKHLERRKNYCHIVIAPHTKDGGEGGN